MKKVFFTVIGIVIGIALGSGIMYVINNDSKNSDKKENNNLNSEEEVEINDIIFKEYLTKKAYELHVKYDINDLADDSFSIYWNSLRVGLYADLTLTSDEKLEVALRETYNYDPVSVDFKDDSGYTYTYTYTRFIKQSDVEEIYYKYFGTKEFTNKDLITCNVTYKYDEEKKGYYYFDNPVCGGTGPGYYYFYFNKVTTKGNEAYVYVNVSRLAGEMDSNTYAFSDTYTIYKDVSETKVYKENVTEEEKKQFKIDETNYKEFDEYKFIFEKNKEGHYYFKSISKVN